MKKNFKVYVYKVTSEAVVNLRAKNEKEAKKKAVLLAGKKIPFKASDCTGIAYAFAHTNSK